MKIIQTIFLITILVTQTMGQNIDSLERKLGSKKLATSDSIEILNQISRGLTFVNPVKALDYANKALELSTATDNSLGEAYAYRNLASIHSYNESYFISMEYLQRALEIFMLNNDSVGIGNCYISLGHTYRRLQNTKEEVNYHLKSYEIFKKRNDKERVGVTAHNLGESYFNIKDLAKSRELTLYAIKINDSLNNQSVLSSCYKVMGLIELAENNFELAENYFKRVIEIATRLGVNSQKVATAESMIQLATVYKIMEDKRNQYKFLMCALEFSKANNLPTYVQKAYQELILYSSNNNDQEAVKRFTNLYIILNDSLNKKQLRDKYSLTKSIVQVHELSKSRNDLEKANLLQLQKIQSRNTLIIVIAVSLIVLLWLLLKFVWLNKKLKNQNAIIETQKKDLEILNNTKDKFFGIVAHDLKSPLNSLKSFSSLLIEHFDNLSKEEILTLSKQLRESVDNTIKMADNLITWARIQMNDYQYNMETIKVKDIASSVCDVYKDVASKKGIKVSCSVEDSLTVTGDKNQIEFVVRNLVNNAIKFTDKDGFVSLTAKALPGRQVQISVKDSGVGISDESKKKLFSIGHKQSTDGTAGEKGTGLGLMLSFEFVKLNGGQIDIESILGKGTTFYAQFESGRELSS
ncbi:MAG: ATP-binding protein [Cyclobacteriaceae bacterium]